jgi:predicted AAA+ superfamily ATPase
LKRTAIEHLIKWNQTSDVRPVLLTGSKGVGKTYLACDFAKSFFKRILYLNFEHDPYAIELFQANDPFLVSKRLLEYFKLDNTTDEATIIEDRLLILDEISYCPSALHMLTSIQYTGEFPRIIAISSHSIENKEKELFYHIPIYPMQFNEFLVAIAKDWYIEAILTHFESNKMIPDIVHKELLALHDLYLQIGGMPGIINEYLNFNNLSNIPEQHSLLMGTYKNYQSVNNTDGEALKMNQVLDSLPLQLIKNNKKFQYKLIRKGTTHSMYKDAIMRLADQNYVIPGYKIPTECLSDPCAILEGNRLSINEITSFKLYLSDVGMFHSQLTKHSQKPFNNSTRKALLENYIAQELQANGYPILFWESESMAKIDFLLPKDNEFIPIEVFCENNTRSKSASVLKQTIDFTYSIKISSRNFEFNKNVKYVPYYAVFCL